MRNRYPGTCYRCGERVEPGAGHFEITGGTGMDKWRTQHAECAIAYRGMNFVDGSQRRPRSKGDAEQINEKLTGASP